MSGVRARTSPKKQRSKDEKPLRNIADVRIGNKTGGRTYFPTENRFKWQRPINEFDAFYDLPSCITTKVLFFAPLYLLLLFCVLEVKSRSFEENVYARGSVVGGWVRGARKRRRGLGCVCVCCGGFPARGRRRVRVSLRRFGTRGVLFFSALPPV